MKFALVSSRQCGPDVRRFVSLYLMRGRCVVLACYIYTQIYIYTHGGRNRNMVSDALSQLGSSGEQAVCHLSDEQYSFRRPVPPRGPRGNRISMTIGILQPRPTGHKFYSLHLSLSKCWYGSQFPSCFCVLLMLLLLVKISFIAVKANKIISPNYTSTLIQKSKSRGPCLKPMLITILTPLFPLYFYQKDERAKPGNLLTNDGLFPSPQ
jgi:hypothetical protein